MSWVFGDCELDEALFQLRRAGRPVKVEPKVFDVLLYLLRHCDRVVSKDELLDALWPGETVTESVLPRCVAAARRATGDDRASQRVIQTVHGRGYRFVADLRDAAPETHSAAVRAPEAPPAVTAGADFVGRREVIERAQRALGEAAAGRGRLLLLVGEPGIGKTRTAEEIGARARARGFRGFEGRCFEGEGAPAYWPWVQILRRCVEQASEPELAADLAPSARELAALVPELRERLPGLPEHGDLSGEHARFRLFDAVARALRRMGARRPLVLSLDDLHWADADSLQLLQWLAGELRDAPLLILGTYRDVEVRRDHPLAPLLGALARLPRCERVALDGLAPAEIGTLVGRLGGAAAKPELVEAIGRMTDGNPFFIHEVARWLVDGAGPDALDAGTLDLALPQSVRDAIGRRLDALSPACNELLRAAAVGGRSFAGRVVQAVAGSAADETLEAIGEALDARVLVESTEGSGRYAFHHALTRQTLYEELSVPARVRLHRRFGEALEQAYGPRAEDHLAELAHHFFEAAPGGDAQKAVDYAARAARHAHRLCAYDEAARHATRALEALDLAIPADESRRGALLADLGESLLAGGGRARAREHFLEAAELARRLAQPALLARAAVGYRGFAEMGAPPDPRALALLEEALDGLGEGHPALRARVLARLTGSAPHSRSMANRRRLAAEAQRLARTADDLDAARDALTARYWAALGPDQLEERFAVADEMLSLARRHDDRYLEIVACEVRLGAHLVRGEFDAADREVERYGALAAELRMPVFLFLATVIRASRALDRGRFEEAERGFAEALEHGRGAVPFGELLHAGQGFWLGVLRGETAVFGGAAEFLEGVFAGSLAGVETVIRAAVALGRAVRGDVEPARRVLEALAARGFEDVERDEHWLLTCGVLAQLCIRLDDVERGRRLYDLLVPHADLVLMHDLLRTSLGSVQGTLGALAALAGERGAALEHLERAVAAEERMGARPALLRSRGYLARLLAVRGAGGDPARAAALWQQVEAEAEALGVRPESFGPPPAL